MTLIKVEQGNEFRIYGRRIIKNDIFFNAYEQAAAILDDIVIASDSEKEDDSNLQGTDKLPPDFLNNIIAFTGERGQGKSSAMTAFTNTLTDGIFSSEIIKFSDHTKKHTFIKLDKIDPTTFDSPNNILEVIVARLFNSFEELYQNSKSKINVDTKNEIMQLFENAYESICHTRNAKLLGNLEMDYETNIQKLAYVSNGTSLQNTIWKLIQKYLGLHQEIQKKLESDKFNNSKAPFLVIPIDDLDINIDYAYQMAEQIRKYLIIPNVVIIMAVNIEQLKLCAKKQFYENLSSMKADGYEGELDALSTRMAAKYIDKLIPDGRKIALPIISTFEESGRDAISLVYNNRQRKNLLEKYKGKGLQDTLLGFIFDRTQIIFVPRIKGFGVHPIIPSTLRELVNLLSVLGKMALLPEDEDSYKVTLLQNLHVFENFFINTWCSNNLDHGNMEIIQKIHGESPLSKHQFVVSQVMDIVDKSKMYTADTTSPLRPSKYALMTLKEKISENKANPLLNSLGDVMLMLDILSYRYVNDQTSSLVFAIKVIYTITLKRIWLTQEDQSSEERPTGPSTFHQYLGSGLWSETFDGLLRGNRDAFSFKPSSALFGDENRKSASTVKEHEFPDVLLLAYLCDFPVKSSRISIPDYSRQLYPRNNIIVNEARFNLSNLLISAVDYKYLPYKTGLNYNKDYQKYLDVFREGINEDSLLLILLNYELIELIQIKLAQHYPDRESKKGMDEGEYINDFIHLLNRLFDDISYFSENEKRMVLFKDSFRQRLVEVFAVYRDCRSEAGIVAEENWDNLEPRWQKRYDTAKNTVSKTIDNPREQSPSSPTEIGEICTGPYFRNSVLNLAYNLSYYGNRPDSPVPFDDELKNRVRDLYAKSAVIISRDGNSAKITESMWTAFNECVNKINSTLDEYTR